MPRMFPFYVCRHVVRLNSSVSDLKEICRWGETRQPLR